MNASATKSEALFEQFLSENAIPFRRVSTATGKTPDYEIEIGGRCVVVEVKELTSDPAFGEEAGSRTVGDHVRKRITKAGPQLQEASEAGKPTILLIFNNLDPMRLFGTENLDFERAMYGDRTVKIDLRSGKIVDSFHGQNKALQQGKNTSFSALGRLKELHGGSIEVTLFENVHAKVPLDYEGLPGCFEIVRVEYPSHS